MDNEQGRKPTASRVAANLREVRKARGLDLADVSARMARLGRPLSISGLSKVERGQRGVDVDDLVALALALDVTPNRLLLTAEATPEGITELTPKMGASPAACWRWATGDEAFRVDPWSDKPNVLDLDRLERWHRENRPHDPPDETLAKDLFEHEDELRRISQSIDRLEEQGLGRKAIVTYMEIISTRGAAVLSPSRGSAGRRDDDGER